jgi:glycerol-3-phosphate acyltransferase PlsX
MAAELVRISVDGMGGDFAPANVVSGCVQAASEYDVRIVLVGRQEQLKAELGQYEVRPGRIEIIDAPDLVGMEESPAAALRRKRNSSMAVAVELAGQGNVDGIISAGNTGAMYAMVKFRIGTLPGVDRMPLAALFPHPAGRTMVLDVGANVDCKPHHLLEFAVMGSIYAEEILNIPTPRVGLLSIGTEEAKGNEQIRETFGILKESGLNFTGNVEGHDLFKGSADVIVCDGFIGNVALKASESLVDIIFHLLAQETVQHPEIGALLTRYFDYSEYGGAPLLGARVPSIVCHGRSTPKAIKNAVRVARDLCRNRVNERIHKRIAGNS